jgi:class 3 adenylate cyclase
VAELPSGTVTFLFTDIEGSTRLLKELRERYGDVRGEHDRIMRAAFAEAGGQEVDTQGDAFFVAFRRARDAVAVAVAAQRSLLGHAWPDGVLVRVRMGIHTGEPTVGQDRYVGLGVNRAARICSAAHGGQVLLSNTTRDLVEDDLPFDVGLRDLGEHTLKDTMAPLPRFSPRVSRSAPWRCSSTRASYSRSRPYDSTAQALWRGSFPSLGLCGARKMADPPRRGLWHST